MLRLDPCLTRVGVKREFPPEFSQGHGIEISMKNRIIFGPIFTRDTGFLSMDLVRPNVGYRTAGGSLALQQIHGLSGGQVRRVEGLSTRKNY